MRRGYRPGRRLRRRGPRDVGLAGVIGGAINTGTLRGAVVGGATAEAFWGVGEFAKPALGSPTQAGVTLNPAQAVGSAALHAAVGCVSSAAGGGQCASGALSAGLGDLVVTEVGPLLSQNIFVQAAVAGLGGGTGAALTGGRFGDGFFIASSGYLFNQAAHNGEGGPESQERKEEAPVSLLGGTGWFGASRFAPLDPGPLASWGSPDTLDDHFVRHGGDFGSPSASAYAGQASASYKAHRFWDCQL